MWIQVDQNCCLNLDQAERVVVRAIKEPDLTLPDSPAPAQNIACVDVEACFPDERRYVLASFPITPECGHDQAEANAGAVFAQLMRAMGTQSALVDLRQPEKPSAPPVTAEVPAGFFRFAM